MIDVEVAGLVLARIALPIVLGVLLGCGIRRAYRRARRDYFAAAWLSTMRLSDGHGLTADEVARRCYGMADAMERVRR